MNEKVQSKKEELFRKNFQFPWNFNAFQQNIVIKKVKKNCSFFIEYKIEDFRNESALHLPKKRNTSRKQADIGQCGVMF